VVGAVLLALLVAANVWGAVIGEIRSRESLRYAPPSWAPIRTLLWEHQVREEIADDGAGVFASGAMDSSSTVFSSTPAQRARLGEPYRYRPSSNLELSAFTVSGAPPGIDVDGLSGELSGTARQLGTFPVELQAVVSDGRRVVQRFDLFVDDRLLLLGADQRGRDVFRMLVRAARLTLVPGAIAVAIGVGLGVVAGAFAGFYGGRTRTMVVGVTTVVQSVPGLLLVFLTVVVSNFNLYLAMAMVGVILFPDSANGIRERVEHFKRRDFVEAARELGMRDRAILWSEIVWHNARTVVASRILQGFAYAILVEVTLSFMGFSAPNSESLGEMLRVGRAQAMGQQRSQVEVVAALAALLLIVLTFTLLERGIARSWDRRR